MKESFFVRVAGNVNDKLDEVKAAFGDVDVVTADGLDDEFGFVTEVISEKKYEEAAGRVSGIIGRIRMED